MAGVLNGCPDGGRPSIILHLVNGSPCRLEREDERLARDAGHAGTDEPPQANWDAARERNRFTLHVDAAVPFEKTPVAIEPPEISSVAADGLLALAPGNPSLQRCAKP